MMNTTYSTSTILSGRILVRTKFLLPLLLVLFASSCKKESEVGVGIQPEEDIIGLYTTDTMTLWTTTVREDSMRTDETPTVVLGTCHDDDFGQTRAGVFTQLSIPNNQSNINFFSIGGAVLDSAVLTMAYKFDFYGDTSVAQTLNVYQMTERIYKDSIYYSNRPRSYYPAAVGTKSFYPHPRTSVVVDGDSLAAHIRIPIDYNFANTIFMEGDGSGALNSEDSWADFMNGLYVEADGATGKSLQYMNMIDTLTGLKLYYHNDSGATSFTFIVGTSTPYYSYYQHNYPLSITSILGDRFVGVNHIQSNAGLKTKIEFPFLNAWYDSLGYEAAINKAELVIFGVAPTDPDRFPLNTRMFVTSIDSAGKERLLIDMFESATYYGGSLNTTTNVYKINMARYIQSILTGEQPNNGIYLKEIFGAENGRRSIIGSSSGSADPNLKMYLRLTYTRIN